MILTRALPKLILLLLSTLLVLSLVSCGQKGGLTRPEQSSFASTAQ